MTRNRRPDAIDAGIICLVIFILGWLLGIADLISHLLGHEPNPFFEMVITIAAIAGPIALIASLRAVDIRERKDLNALAERDPKTDKGLTANRLAFCSAIAAVCAIITIAVGAYLRQDSLVLFGAVLLIVSIMCLIIFDRIAQRHPIRPIDIHIDTYPNREEK